jgi:hypothetical protein
MGHGPKIVPWWEPRSWAPARYNVQFATDTKSTAMSVDNSDMGKMLPMNDALARQYGTRPRQHLADGRLMCYKSPWGRGREKRRPFTLAGGPWPRPVDIKLGRNYPARPRERSAHN